MPKTSAQTNKYKPEPKKELTLTLSLFKIEGHGTYRILLNKDEADWVRQTSSKGFPKVTERKIFIVDKIRGTVKEK